MNAVSLAQLNFRVYLAFYTLGILLAELAITYLNPLSGLIIHAALLVLILLHASLWANSDERKFLLALTLAPLIRLVSLSMPLQQFEIMYWYPIVGLPLLLASVMVYRLSKYKPVEVGLALGEKRPIQLGIGLTGLGLGFVEYLILKPEPLVEHFSLQSIWLPALNLLVFTAFLEELIFRGLMQSASAEPLKKHGLWCISLLFAVLYLGYNSWINLVFIFLAGVFFSLVVERTRSLVGVTLAHGLTNISLFLIFPFILSAQP
jgi:hypothetical protein